MRLLEMAPELGFPIPDAAAFCRIDEGLDLRFANHHDPGISFDTGRGEQR